MTFLRDGDAINFQRASCTLDGCVRIYSSRIDSAVDETGKLLSGLSSSAASKGWGTKEEAEEDGVANEGDEAAGERERVGKKKRAGRTLEPAEKAAETLCLRLQDLEAAVDPLFRKMCADFDEGNVANSGRGHLLSQLAIEPLEYRLLFDGDSPLPPVGQTEPDQQLDLNVAEICQHFAADFNFLLTAPPLCPSLLAMAPASATPSVVPVWIGQAVSKAQEPMNEHFSDDDEEEGDAEGGLSAAVILPEPTHPLPGAVSFEGADQYVDFGYDDDLGGDFEDEAVEQTEAALVPALPGAAHPFAEPVMAGSSWAGPEHWRINLARRPPAATSAAVPKEAREKKKRQELDFYQTEIDLATLFAKPASSMTISLSRAMIEERQAQNYCLPPDLHYGSQQLLRTFTKPGWRIGQRKTLVTQSVPKVQVHEAAAEGVDWTAEAKLLAQEMNEQSAPAMDLPGVDDDFGGDFGFDDHAGFEYNPTEDATQVDFTNQLPTQSLNLTNVSTLPLQYARVAKRIDIQLLKRSMWQELEGVQTLSQVMHKLPQTDFPPEQLKDVSAAYCFICLLHLANEHSLDLLRLDSGDLRIEPSQK